MVICIGPLCDVSFRRAKGYEDSYAAAVGGLTFGSWSWDLDEDSDGITWGEHKMVTPQTQPDTPEALATERAHSRRPAAIFAGAIVLVMLAVIGVHYVAFRSLPTTVSWAPSASAIAPGGALTVTGRVTPAESGRQVVFQSAPRTQGPWQPIYLTATTDGRGQFAVTFTPQLSASIVLRVVVDPTGRYLEVAGVPKPVGLLSLSTISIKGGGVISTPEPLTFTLAVAPTRAGRTVRIEQSRDKVHWVPVGSSVQTKSDRLSVVVTVPRPAVGVWSYRGTVAQDDGFAAAVSPLVGATVEDMKVVAARTAAAHARAVAELARQVKTTADRNAAHAEAGRQAANNAPSTRPVPQYGYQCRDGDEKLYSVCASHRAWVDGQTAYFACIDAARTWDIATQKCR